VSANPYDLMLDEMERASAPKPSRAPKRYGAYEARTEGRWSISDAPKVKDWYKQTYGRDLPVTAFGQSGTHNRMGLNHSDSMDVGINPTTDEGRALTDYLRQNNIPFLAYDRAVPGAATNAHVHVGYPSRGGTPSPKNEYDRLLDEMTGAAPPTPAPPPLLPPPDRRSPANYTADAIPNGNNSLAPRRESVSSTADTDVQLETPRPATPPAKEVAFTPYTGEEQGPLARAAMELAAMTRTFDNPPKFDAPNPDDVGRAVRLKVPARDGKPPSNYELSLEAAKAVAPEIAQAVENYKRETGRDLWQINAGQFQDRLIRDPEGDYYDVVVSPTRSDIEVANAYNRGGIDAAQEAATNAGQNRGRYVDAYNSSLAERKQHVAGRGAIDRAAVTGEGIVEDAAQGYLHFANNVSSFADAIYTGTRYGWDSPEYQRLNLSEQDTRKAMDASARLLHAEANEQGSAARIVRGIGSGVAQLPKYMMAGPYGAGAIAAIESAERGPRAMIGEGVKMNVLSALGELSGGLQNPVARQAVGRIAGGAFFAGSSALEGERDPRALGEQFATGFGMSGPGAAHERAGEPLPRIAPTERTARRSALDMPEVAVRTLEAPRVVKPDTPAPAPEVITEGQGAQAGRIPAPAPDTVRRIHGTSADSVPGIFKGGLNYKSTLHDTTLSAEGLTDADIHSYTKHVGRQAGKGDATVIVDLPRAEARAADEKVGRGEYGRGVISPEHIVGAVQDGQFIPNPNYKGAMTTETIIRHSDPRIDGGRVVGQTADGRLKVENNEGGVSVVQHPRKQGNREATLVRREAAPQTPEGVDATSDTRTPDGTAIQDRPTLGGGEAAGAGVPRGDGEIAPPAIDAARDRVGAADGGMDAGLTRAGDVAATNVSRPRDVESTAPVVRPNVPAPEAALAPDYSRTPPRPEDLRSMLSVGKRQHHVAAFVEKSSHRDEILNEIGPGAKYDYDASFGINPLTFDTPRGRVELKVGYKADEGPGVRYFGRGGSDEGVLLRRASARPKAEGLSAVAAELTLRAPVPDSRAFRGQMKTAFNLSDAQADAVTEIVDARASAWAKVNGRNPSDYYAERFGGIVRGGEASADALNQEAPKRLEVRKERYYERRGDTGPFHDVWRVYDENGKKMAGTDFTSEASARSRAREIEYMLAHPDEYRQSNKAAVEFMRDGRAVVRAFKQADVSSAWHELAHVFRRDLHPELLKDAEDAIGVKDSNWTKEHDEKFARGFERYLKTGEAPTVKLRRVFEAAKQWLTEIYGAVRGKTHPLNFKPNEQLVSVFDRMLGGEPKGEFGQLIHNLHKAPEEGTPAFFENAQVKRALGLKPDASTADVRAALTEQIGKPRSSHLSPEDVTRWADSRGVDGAARKALDFGVEKYRETIRKPTEYEQTGIRKNRYDPATDSVSQAVRAMGGLRITDDNRGEMRRLNETTTGLTRKGGGLGADEMITRLKEDGYFAPDEDVSIADFLSLLEEDAAGLSKHYSSQKEYDYEEMYRKENPQDNTDALDSFLANEVNGILYDKVADGTATRREVEEFKRIAAEHGVFPEHVSTLIRQGKGAKAAGVQGSVGGQAEGSAARARRDSDVEFDPSAYESEGEILFQSNHNPRQLGFVNEGLAQRDARRDQPKPQFDDAKTDAAKKALGPEAYAKLSELKDSPVARIAHEVEKRANQSNAQNAPDVLKALSTLAELKRTKQTVSDYLSQGSLFGDRELTPRQEQILSALDRNPRKVIDEAFPEEKGPTQDVLFQADHTPAARRQRAYRALLRDRQPDLFDEMGRPLRTGRARSAGKSNDKRQPALTPELENPAKRRGVIGTASNVANAIRALNATGEFSFLLRQGGVGFATHPIESTRAAWRSRRALTSSREQHAAMERELKNHPAYALAKKSGLELTDAENKSRAAHEEDYQSDFVAKIPGIRHVEQATTTFLNAQRLAIFSRYAKTLRKANVPESAYKEAARLVNYATGRGDLGRLNAHAPLLTTALFSPRFTASRFQLLNKLYNPAAYVERSGRGLKFKDTARIQLTEAVKYAGVMLGTMYLAKQAGATVSTDPDDPNFGKVKWGNYAYDITSGNQTTLRYLLRAAKALKNHATSREAEKDKDVLELTWNFLKTKAAPGVRIGYELLKGEDLVTHNKTTPVYDRTGQRESTLAKAALPIFFRELYQSMSRDGFLGLGAQAPNALGVGVSDERDFRRSKRSSSPVPIPHLPPPPKVRP
jgi:hypothetical protein